MAKKILPPVEMLRELMDYNPETGVFHWKKRDISMFPSARIGNSWNAKHVGKQALIVDNHGYKKGRIFGEDFMAHRIAWAIYYGEWPAEDLDHINGDRSDNRICNLRLATDSENLRNRGAQKNNSSGYKGVHFCNRSKSWIAKLQVEKKNVYIGKFSTPEDAYAAYCMAAPKHHGEFARTK